MTQREWLKDKDNQDAVYAIVERALTELQPDEVPFLEGFYDNYIELAREGDVTLDSDGQPFNFIGGEEFVAMWLIPLVIQIVGELITAGGRPLLKRLIDRLRAQGGTVESPEEPAPVFESAERPDSAKPLPGADEIRNCIRSSLNSFTVGDADRERLEATLVASLSALL